MSGSGNVVEQARQGGSLPQTTWFAAYTRPHREGTVTCSLEGRGYEVLFPLGGFSIQANGRSRNRLPLFPGYVFVRCDWQQRLPVLQTPGLLHMVSDRAGPLPVADFEIENIRLAMSSGLRIDPAPFLSVGDRIQIRRGPLAGLDGILVEQRNELRVVISVELLARSVAVEVHRSWLERAACA
jgi:transcriptional antiterminator NusG